MSDASDARQHADRTLLILVVGGLAYALAQTLIVPAIPAIQRDTGTSQETASWLLTAFLLSSSVATPLIGRLGDMLGKERVLLWSLAIFGVGSLISALGSHSMGVLIGGRIVQGAGGAIFPLCFGIIRDEFPRERIASSIGLLSTTYGIGGGLGLVLAGLFVEHLSVAWMFWFSVAITIVASWATWRYVPESPVRVDARIDWGGGLLLSLGLTMVLLGVSQSAPWGWADSRTLALIAGGLAICAIFCAYERQASEPLVDMKLMSLRGVWTPNLAAFCVGAAMFGTFILIPELVQTDKTNGYGFGLGVLTAGLVMLPLSAIMLFAGPLAGRMTDRVGARIPLFIGGAGAAIAFAIYAGLHDHLWAIAVAGAPFGLGIGLALAAMATLVVDASPQDKTGVSMGINTIMRNVGGAVGGQVAASLLASKTLGSGVPAESGYTAAFVMSAGIAVVAMAATMLVPRPDAEPRWRRVATQEATA